MTKIVFMTGALDHRRRRPRWGADATFYSGARRPHRPAKKGRQVVAETDDTRVPSIVAMGPGALPVRRQRDRRGGLLGLEPILGPDRARLRKPRCLRLGLARCGR